MEAQDSTNHGLEHDGDCDPNLLIEAAEFLLRAEAKAKGGAYVISVQRGERGATHPDVFTVEELNRGMEFLIRLGLIVPR